MKNNDNQDQSSPTTAKQKSHDATSTPQKKVASSGSGSRRNAKRAITTNQEPTDVNTHEKSHAEGKSSVLQATAQKEHQSITSSAKPSEAKDSSIFEILLSQSLRSKLEDIAKKEGLSSTDLAREFIAEGLMLRAFDIIGRQHNVRGNSNPHPNQKNHQNFRNQNRNQHKNHNSGQSNQNYRSGNHNNKRVDIHQLMDDKASFMEYVRNQERKHR